MRCYESVPSGCILEGLNCYLCFMPKTKKKGPKLTYRDSKNTYLPSDNMSMEDIERIMSLQGGFPLGEAVVEDQGGPRIYSREGLSQFAKQGSKYGLEAARDLPYVGEALDAGDIYSAGKTGKDLSGYDATPKGRAGMLAAGLLIPNIIERPVKAGFRALKNLTKPTSEALSNITRGALQGSETTKASHQLFTDFIKKHHPETFSKLKAGTLDVADLASDPKYIDDFANRYSTTYRGVAARNEEEARRFMTEHRSNPNQEMDGAGIYSTPSAETAATYAATGSSTLGGKASTVLDNEYFRRAAKEGVHPYVGVVKNEVPYKTPDDLWKWLKNNEQMGGAFNEGSGILSNSAQRVTRPGTSLSLEDIVKIPSSEGHILKNKNFGNSDHIWNSDELKSILRPTLRSGGKLIKKKSGGKFRLLKK